MQKITKIVGLSFEGGGGENFFSKPNISPIFGTIFLAIFRNLARNISPNYEANEINLGRLLGHRTV